jgi:hypothetical protein
MLFSYAEKTTFPPVIITLSIPLLPSGRFSWVQRLRLSIGNAEEVLRRDRGTETQKWKQATSNGLSYYINSLHLFGHCTYESSATTSGEGCGLPVEVYKKAGPFLTPPYIL